MIPNWIVQCVLGRKARKKRDMACSTLIFAQICNGVGEGGLGETRATLNGHYFFSYGPIFKIQKLACSPRALLCRNVPSRGAEIGLNDKFAKI